MSKIIKNILQDVTWLQDLSTILTVFFVIIFIVLVVSVLRWKKEKVEEYKNIPLSDNQDDNL
jgi:cbb3-type cytochrome oxidase subunit 3